MICQVSTESRLLRAECLAVLTNEDMTSEEVAERICKRHGAVATQIFELFVHELVFDSGRMKAGSDGFDMIIWTTKMHIPAPAHFPTPLIPASDQAGRRGEYPNRNRGGN